MTIETHCCYFSMYTVRLAERSKNACSSLSRAISLQFMCEVAILCNLESAPKVLFPSRDE